MSSTSAFSPRSVVVVVVMVTMVVAAVVVTMVVAVVVTMVVVVMMMMVVMAGCDIHRHGVRLGRVLAGTAREHRVVFLGLRRSQPELVVAGIVGLRGVNLRGRSMDRAEKLDLAADNDTVLARESPEQLDTLPRLDIALRRVEAQTRGLRRVMPTPGLARRYVRRPCR